MAELMAPSACIGILGGGQLGRMTALAARRMGFRIWCLDPDPDCPAAGVCDRLLVAPYDDPAAAADLASGCSVVTLEFENIAAEAAEAAASRAPMRPSPEILSLCQNREREKAFLSTHGFPCAPYAAIGSPEALTAALGRVGLPAILKSADFGYDGKGQVEIRPGDDPVAAWQRAGERRAVLEKKIELAAELSVLVARNSHGRMELFPVAENIHRDHILDTTLAPGRFPPSLVAQASDLAAEIASALKLEGLLAVEMFLEASGRLLVNELAPRPHNSGHFTFDACITSQFEQLVRAICGLPLGSPALLSSGAVMGNLLGHLWLDGEPDWTPLLAEPLAKLHLYGKTRAHPGRKMGHVTILAAPEQGLPIWRRLRSALRDEELRGRAASL